MSNPITEKEWAVFYENSLEKFSKEMGFVPTFEEFQVAVTSINLFLSYQRKNEGNKRGSSIDEGDVRIGRE